MCVIAYQTSKQDLLTYDEIKNMALSNPHGMGWMANIGGIIKYKKGYFNVDKFYNDYVSLRKNKKLIDIALHFRIGTGSAIDVANCHPFPVTSVKKRIKSPQGTCDIAVMMNGIIGDSTHEFSDTALYVMNNLRKYYEKDHRWFLHMNKQQKILFDNEIHGCRFVLMCKDGTKLFGYGWSDYEGKAQVSNRHWIPTIIPSYYWDRDYNFDDDYYGEWNTKRANRFAKPKDRERYKSYIDYLLTDSPF